MIKHLRSNGLFSKFSRTQNQRRKLSVESIESRILLAADLTLDVGDADASVAPGETVVYTFDYANVGDTATAGVEINTRLPRNTSFDPANSDARWTCSDRSRPTCSIELGEVGAEVADGVALALIVDADASSRLRSISIFGTISDNGEAGREASRRNNFSFERTPVVHQLHDLTMNFHDSRATVNPGGTIIYTAEYANAGNEVAPGAAITIQLPEQTTFNVEASSAGWNCIDGTCTLDVGDVPAGESGSATFAVDVASDLPTNVRSIRASASIIDDGTGAKDASTRNNSDPAWTPVVHALPDLALSIDDADQAVSAGESIVYSLTYANEGQLDATGAVIKINVPRHTSFDAANSSDGWSCDDDGRCSLEVGTVAAGASMSVNFAVVVDPDVSTRVRSIFALARVADDGAQGREQKRWNNYDYKRIAVKHTLPDVAVDLIAPEAIAAGASAVYTLNYSNVGPVDATGVNIRFRLPRNASVDLANSPEGWNCEGRNCTVEIGNLAASATGSTTIAVTIDADATRRVYASAKITDDGENGRDGNRRNNYSVSRVSLDAVDPMDEGQEEG